MEFRSVPIIGQYLACRARHYSASLLEFSYIILASLLPIAVASGVEYAAGVLKTPSGWAARFAPDLSIASSTMIAPLMYLFVSSIRADIESRSADFPHKGSLQFLSLLVFATGVVLYVIFSSIPFFKENIAAAVRSFFDVFGIIAYSLSLFISYTAVLFRNFAESPDPPDQDQGVGDIVDDLRAAHQ